MPDRLIQQAIAQYRPRCSILFVPVSYGFRPGKSAHDAVKVARLVIEQGIGGWSRLIWMRFGSGQPRHSDIPVARQVKKTSGCSLIRAYLEAGIMVDGVRQRAGGDPAGSPLAVALEHHA